MATKIQVRRGTAAAWTSANPTLSEGEIGLETDTGLEKRGDGATAWVTLAYHLPKQIHGVASKATPIDADEIPLVDTAASNGLKKLTFVNLLATIWARLGALIAGGTDKATPADADTLGIADSAASSATKKLTFANLLVWIKAKLTALAAKATPIDADSVLINDSAASGVPKQTTLTNFKAFLKTYFDGVYGALANTPDLAGKGAADDIGDASGASTAAKILALVESVDGTGSGLDADLLDGQHASFFTNLDNISGGATYARTTIAGAAAANDIGASVGALIKDKLITAIAASAAGTSMLRAANAAAQRTLLSVEENADVTDAANVGAAIHGSAAKTTPIDADTLAGINSASSNVLTKFTFANIWVWIQAKIAGASSKTTPVDADSILGVDSESSNVSKRFTFTNLGAWIWTKLGALIAGGTAKAIPLDADTFPLSSAADSNATRKLSFANLKSVIATALVHGGSNEISSATPAANTIPKSTSGSKLDAWISDATALVKGLLLLGTSGGAVKDTTMPDGATAVYAQDAWATTDSWGKDNGNLSVSGGVLRFTATSPADCDIYKAGISLPGKTLAVRIRASKSLSVKLMYGSYIASTMAVTTDWQTFLCTNVLSGTAIFLAPMVSNDWFEIDWIWIGDYSYLAGSLSEEAARIANQVGDLPGIPVAASGTITSNGTNVNVPATGIFTTDASLPVAGSTFSVNGTLYTWVTGKVPNTEGEVLIGATVADCLTNAKNAVNGDAGTKGTTHFCTANTYVTAASDATKLTVTAKLRGTVGNAYTLAVSGTDCHLTVSAATMGSGTGATIGVDNTVTIAGKQYKFVGALSGSAVEGEVKVGGTYSGSLIYLKNALVLDIGTYGSTHWCSLAHPLVSAANTLAAVLTLTAKTTGESGNSITLAKSASTLTLSSSTLLGGVSDAAAKIKALVEQNNTFDIPVTAETALLTTLLATTGANLAAKLAAATAAASTSAQGATEYATAAEIVAGADDTRAVNVKQLRDAADLARMFLTKRTTMPDGATLKTPTDAAWTGWNAIGGATKSVVDGKLRLICASGGGYLTYTYPTPAVYGEVLFIRGKVLSGTPSAYNLNARLDTTTTEVSIGTISSSSLTNNFYAFIKPSGAPTLILYVGSSGSGVYTAEFEVIAVGSNLSYLTGSLSEEAARIANELGDTAGVGVVASGTITATDVATATKGDIIAGKKYTYVAALTASPGVEGEVLKGATKEDDLENLNLAISEAARTNNGTKYWAAAVHPLVSSSRANAILTLTAKTTGLLGNQITTVCEAGTNHTASGTTLTGGKDAVGGKIQTQMQTLPASATLYGATKLVTNAAEVTAGTSSNSMTPATLKDSTPPLNGIKFPATQVPSADANTLDDYEEGTATATLICGTSGTITLNAGYQTLSYTKIGRMVSVRGVLIVASVSSPLGLCILEGLPFANINNWQRVTPLVAFINGQNASPTGTIRVLTDYGNNKLNIVRIDPNGVAVGDSATMFKESTELRISGYYEV